MEEVCDDSRFWAAWEKPLSEEAPCGEDVCFSSEFEALKAEADKSSSLHATSGTDWNLVIHLASELLAKQGKDIWAFSYAIYATYQVDGLNTCASAIAAFTRTLETHWDGMYPPLARMQRRLAPLQWLCDRLGHAAETTCFINATPEDVSALRKECAVLQAFLDAKVGDAAPSFSGIFLKIPGIDAPATPLASEAPTTPGVPKETLRASALQPLAATLAAMDADGRVPPAVLPQLVRDVIAQTRQLAGHFLSLNVLDERAYLLHRAALWGTLLQLPQTDASHKTQLLPGVPGDRIQAYAAAVDQRQFADILPHLERSAAKAPYWFDGHRLVVRCLEGLKATSAAACVRESLRHLLERFPELLSCSFKDGLPFASPKTQVWLESLGTPSVGVLGSLAETAVHAENTEEQRLREAIDVGQEKGVRDGLVHLGSIPPGRSRAAVQHGILQARYCLALGKKDAASRLLFALYTQLESWNLLDWEPELAARILALFLSTQPAQKGGSFEEMNCRLHWLHLDTALNLMHEP